MSTQPQSPTRLTSEDVIINAPMSYAGSAQRIVRIRRRAHPGWTLVAITVLAVVLVLLAWVVAVYRGKATKVTPFPGLNEPQSGLAFMAFGAFSSSPA